MADVTTQWVVEEWADAIRPGLDGLWAPLVGGFFAAEGEARAALARLRAAGRRVRLVRRDTAVVEEG